jgi:predicted kinase
MLILCRGCPGSGKSTWAKNLVTTYIHLEADMYFIDNLGNYKFDGSKIRYAHQWCMDTTRIFLNQGKHVVVSNTFTTLKEMKFYIDYATENNIPFWVYRMTNNFRSVHDIPEEVMKKMADRFEDYPGEVKLDSESFK